MPGVLKWGKNRLTSVGFIYFERENRKQQRNFCLDCFVTKHITGFWTFKLALLGKLLLLFLLLCEWTQCFHSVDAHFGSLKEIQISYAPLEIVV